MFYLYILRSKRFGTYYTGITGNLENRLTQHNLGRVRSTKFRKPWLLVYIEKFKSLGEARQRELFLKSQKKREVVEKLIKHF